MKVETGTEAVALLAAQHDRRARWGAAGYHAAMTRTTVEGLFHDRTAATLRALAATNESLVKERDEARGYLIRNIIEPLHPECKPLPDLIGKDKALGNLLQEVHETLNFTLLALVVLHVAAALQHHFIERQPFLQRMGWGRTKS